jgi:hypothetical protein
MFIFFIWVLWFMLLFRVFGDLFRRRDIGGGTKTVWIIFVILLPFLGVFIYLITQSNNMTDRDTESMQEVKAQTDAHIKSVVAGSSATDQIMQAKQLLDSGAITQAEFDSLKQKALA